MKVPVELKAGVPTYGARRHKLHTLSCHQIQHYAVNKPSAVSVWVSTLQQCDRSTDGTFNVLVAVQFRPPSCRVIRSSLPTFRDNLHISFSVFKHWTRNVSPFQSGPLGCPETSKMVFVLSSRSKISKSYFTVEDGTQRVWRNVGDQTALYAV
jgi:hypothetical protein